MNFSNYRFTLDMQKPKTQASLPVHFGDTGNRFYITLTDGGNPYIIGDGCRVDICIKKPNGVPLINACIIENNALVRYDFNKNTASVEGTHKCELRLYSPEGRLITTPAFLMVVDQNIFYDDEIGTDEDFQKLTALDVIAKEEERRVAEFERWEAEELRALAEKNRVAAEESRDEAENERKEAEAARVLAENARVEAENERGHELSTLKQYVDENINEVSTQVSNHESRIVTNEDNIWYNMERLDSHEASIDAHNTQISTHEERITGIERYLGGDNFIVADSTAYEETIPKNACEKAKVLSIGGMTYKKKTDEGNLMPYPYVGIGGLSYKVANGAITVTSGDATDFIISSGDAVYPAGTYVFEVGEQESNYVEQIGLQFYGTAPTVTRLSNYKCQFTATSNFTITRFTARFSSSSSAQEEFTVTLHPMLYKTDAPITWQPRGEYLSNTKVKAIECKSENYFDINNNLTEHSSKISDTEFTTDRNIYCLANVRVTAGVSYKIKCEVKDIGIAESGLSLGVINGQNMSYGSGENLAVGVGFDTNYKTVELSFVPTSEWVSIVGVPMYMRNMMVVKSDVSTESYIPYVDIDTFAIPEAVQALQGYGEGVSEDDYNYIERTEGGRWLLHKRSGCVDMSTLDFKDGGQSNIDTSTVLYASFPNAKGRSALLCTKFDEIPTLGSWNNMASNQMFCTFDSYILVGAVGYTDIASFKKEMSGVMLYYALAEPIVTDITDLMPKENLIKVLGGCRIVAENEHSDPVPFSIKYLVTYPKEAN